MTNVLCAARIRQNSSTISGLFGFSSTSQPEESSFSLPVSFARSLLLSLFRKEEERSRACADKERGARRLTMVRRNLYVSNLDDKLLSRGRSRPRMALRSEERATSFLPAQRMILSRERRTSLLLVSMRERARMIHSHLFGATILFSLPISFSLASPWGHSRVPRNFTRGAQRRSIFHEGSNETRSFCSPTLLPPLLSTDTRAVRV